MIQNQADRVKHIRATLNLSQEIFGERLGVKKSAISKIENGDNNLSDIMARAICREYNVDYFWLTEGVSDMFTNIPETLLDELSEQYHLNDDYKLILKTFLDAPDSQKEAIKNFLITLSENLQKKDEI